MKRQLFCDVCACMTEHVVDDSEDEGDDLALCCRCGRLHSLPRQEGSAATKPHCETPCRDR